MRLVLALLLLLGSAGVAAAAPYALLDGSNNILGYNDFATTPADPLGKGWRWLPVIVTDPPFDSATQVRTGPVITVGASQVTKVWTVRAKTAQELDDDKTAAIEGLAAAITLALCNHENRIRTLEAKAQITFAQCKAALKALLP
jgi:hypothetical protein